MRYYSDSEVRAELIKAVEHSGQTRAALASTIGVSRDTLYKSMNGCPLNGKVVAWPKFTPVRDVYRRIERG